MRKGLVRCGLALVAGSAFALWRAARARGPKPSPGPAF